MNGQSMSSASGSSLIPDSTSIITGTHFVFMAVFAVLVVLGILWGMRLKHRRDKADEEVLEDNREIETTDRAPAIAAAADTAHGRSNAAYADEPQTETKSAPSPDAATPSSEAPAEPVAAPTAPDAPSEPAREAIPVTRLKGLGPKVAARLEELGITDVRQLAALDDDAAAALDAKLGNFAGRMTRDRWIEQARFLAAGDTAGFEAVFGKL